MSKKLIAVVPAYEPPKEFVNYANELSKSVDSLIVVNDGSGEKYREIFVEISKLPNATLIDYDKNCGKGYALKRALTYIISEYSEDDVIVTADCDGQHKIPDVIKVYKQTLETPHCLVLGSRDFSGDNVPKRSKSGNFNMRKMFSFFYGGNIYDTQTGLRGYTVEQAKKFVTVKGDRFEYELGMLIYARKNLIGIKEIPIETVYPEKTEEHVSHFKTGSDSIKVMRVMLGNIGAYFISSVLSAIADVFIFIFLSKVIFSEESPLYSLIATVTARVLSSVINFYGNFKYVFHGESKKSIFRYYILWLIQLGLSYGNLVLIGNVLGGEIVVVKLLGDLVLALISYQVQKHWVFRNQRDGEFYGSFVRFGKTLLRGFSKRYKCTIVKPEEPVVYVCRHLNMHGPITSLKSFPFDVHPMVLHVFFDEKDCYHQFATYTFSARNNKKAKKFSLKAWFCGFFVPKLVHSAKSIPVYRGTENPMKTLKVSLEFLALGESIAVYPDTEYTWGYDKPSDIYDGFLFLSTMYKRKTGKDLKFVPLYIDDEKREIVERDALVIHNFREEREEAKEYIIREINCRKEQVTAK